MTTTDDEVQRAKRRLFARIVASAHRLDEPFSNAPDQSPWTLLKREMAALDRILADHWMIPKAPYDEQASVRPVLRPNGWISRDEGLSNPEHTRVYAAQLLAAAAEAERRTTDTEEHTP